MGLTEGRDDEQIKDLFTGNTSYFTVPRYQRKYVWKEKNWKQLYEDVIYSLEDEKWSHFIGTFVFQKNEISPQNTEFIIIDGQQRIITLQLLFMSMIAALQKIIVNDTEDKEDVDRYIDIIKDLIKRKPPKGYGIERVSIEYDSNYKLISDAVISNDGIDEIILEKEKSNILQCFDYYYELLKTKSFEQIIEYYEKLITTKYVGFNSYSEEYAYNIFETLNARGTQLKQMELTKNYLFHYLIPKDDIDVYKHKWTEMEDKLFSNDLDCDDFLYHLFKCKFRVKSIRVEDLYDQIKKKVNKDSDLIKDLYYSIVKCIPLYVNVVNCNASNEEVKFLLYYFKIKNNRQFRSALMALFYQLEIGTIQEGTLIDSLTKLRNFLLIYNIRNIPANRIDTDVYDLANRVFEAKCERDVKYYVYQFFLKDRSFFNIESLPTAIYGLRYSNNKRYTMATSGMFVYVFEMLYKAKYADYEYLKDYKKWTMEHIVNDSEENEYVSYIGNLLLITKRLNGICKSKKYDQKKELYLESGFSWVKDYASNQEHKPTKEDITARTNSIAMKLKELILFDMQGMIQYCERTEKVLKFLRELEKNELPVRSK